jgi:hypothetical protein
MTNGNGAWRVWYFMPRATKSVTESIFKMDFRTDTIALEFVESIKRIGGYPDSPVVIPIEQAELFDPNKRN